MAISRVVPSIARGPVSTRCVAVGAIAITRRLVDDAFVDVPSSAKRATDSALLPELP